MIGIAHIPSPVGPLTLAARDTRVCLLHFGADTLVVRQRLSAWYPAERIEPHADPAGAVSALDAYFAGDLEALDRIDVEFTGTPFQKRVWEALRLVRAGGTASYADLARTIGHPNAVRAVGAANGANPVAVIVPCHRIIGSNGTLTGYGGGLERKRWLLEHEGCRLAFF
jgi:methylated-DNA-[protein]-cysteine S-methyltransferase